MQTFNVTRPNGQVVNCISKHAPLYCHAHGLMQTTTGYGKRIATAAMISYNGKWRRVYCAIYSNNGACYIGKLEDGLLVS